MLFVDDERYQRLVAHNAAFPALERTIVARASVPLAVGAERLENLIGTPRDYAPARAGTAAGRSRARR